MEFQVAIKANELLITLSIMEKSQNHDAEYKRPRHQRSPSGSIARSFRSRQN